MLRLEPITPDNWREPLRVREDQRSYVAEGAVLLARAYAYREQHSEARRIVADGVPVGMVLWHDWPEGRRYILSQLYIDQRYQGRGYGREASLLVLDAMRRDGLYSQCELCYVEGDDPARRLYESLGFRPTGDDDENEIGMVLTL